MNSHNIPIFVASHICRGGFDNRGPVSRIDSYRRKYMQLAKYVAKIQDVVRTPYHIID